MFKKAVIVMAAVLLFTGPAHADMVGASDSVIIIKLTSIYNAIKEYYDNGVELLAQAKAQSETLQTISTMTKEIEEEYDFVKNFSLENELNTIVADLQGLSNLDNLEGHSTEEQLKLIRNDIDRRFKSSTTTAERTHYRELKSRLEEVERLSEIQAAKSDEAKKCQSEEMNEKSALASIASSCALMSSLQLAQEQRRAEGDLADAIKENAYEGLDDDFIQALEKMR